MQCYIVLYSNEGYFLIFEKREEAYFFHNAAGPGGVVYPNSVPINNGPGRYAFPGGRLNPGEQPFSGCLREFAEECGRQIVFNYQLGVAQALNTLTTVNIDGAPFNILHGLLNTVAGSYHTVYLQFSTDDLRQILDLVVNTNLVQADNARRDIANNFIVAYNNIFIQYPFCPLDDELNTGEMWQAAREIYEIRLLNLNNATNWYYDMIVYLANTILNLGINY